MDAAALRERHNATSFNTRSVGSRGEGAISTGYHRTYPAPRRAVKLVVIRSQSVRLATSTGVPATTSRSSDKVMPPLYATSTSTSAPGATGLGNNTETSFTAPVWSAPESIFSTLKLKASPWAFTDTHFKAEDICIATADCAMAESLWRIM